MDQYTKMCQAATEIQEAWIPKVGDMVTSSRIDDIAFLEEDDDILKCDVTKPIFPWLPRIEDLIEMSGEKEKDFWYQVVGFMAADDREDIKEILLDYIMRLLYSKSWINNEWVPEDLQIREYPQ